MTFSNARLYQYPLILLTIIALSGCGYNTFQSSDEEIKAAWAEVLNQYQRRADLVPNLVNVVKGYAAHDDACFRRSLTVLGSLRTGAGVCVGSERRASGVSHERRWHQCSSPDV